MCDTSQFDADACPCGSGKSLGACCGPLHAGAAAVTAEALMRSRYSAYVRRDTLYLSDTWHASTRPATISLDRGPRWLGLEILHCAGGGRDDDSGSVEFIARSQQGRRVDALHETSRFVREAGLWFYVEGVSAKETAAKVGRNDPCPCGSGHKLKRCCGK